MDLLSGPLHTFVVSSGHTIGALYLVLVSDRTPSTEEDDTLLQPKASNEQNIIFVIFIIHYPQVHQVCCLVLPKISQA